MGSSPVSSLRGCCTCLTRCLFLWESEGRRPPRLQICESRNSVVPTFYFVTLKLNKKYIYLDSLRMIRILYKVVEAFSAHTAFQTPLRLYSLPSLSEWLHWGNTPPLHSLELWISLQKLPSALTTPLSLVNDVSTKTQQAAEELCSVRV